ncbi:1 4-beta-D-glucan cellobiohydrolase CEL6A [Bienertia sinuspersici]
MSQAIGGVNNLTLQWPVTCNSKARTRSNGKGKTVKVVEREKGKQKKNVGFGEKKRKEPVWQCVQGCGACCKLDKGPTFATPEEIFDDPSDIELYKSMVGADGWCKHFDKSTKTCSIYDDRPYFCRVQPDVFQTLYGINKRKFDKEACSFCKDTIKAIYGADSEVLDRFNKAIRN